MRFETYLQRDATDATSGDNGWQGINSTLDRPNVPQGFLYRGENTRCRTGRVRQRSGTYMPGDFNPPAGFGVSTLVGSGVFRDPNGNELLVVAPALQTYTWNLAHGRDPFKTNYSVVVNVPPDAPSGNNGAGGGVNGVQFVQAFDKLLMLRRPGTGGENLVWDGGTTTAWLKVVLSSTGRTIIPAMFNGEPFQDRIIFYKANAPAVGTRDEWLMSDAEDYSSYDQVFQAFRTNTAEGDFITRVMTYYRNSVVIFKNQSIHLSEFLPTYPLSRTERVINKTIGGVGNKMPVMVGGDILFASMPNGFYSLSEVIQEQITTLPSPISEPIQKVINQINWPITLQMGCSQALDNYAFFGVALGRGATRLNAILVYDTQRKQWESAGDTWGDPAFNFNALHLTNYDNVQRLFAIDYATATIYLLYEGLNDELLSGTFAVPFVMETRGYVGDDPIGFKRFGRATIGISTYNPEVTVTAVMDGAFEEKVLTPTPITKDRLRYYTHGTPPFDVLTDDPEAMKRQDYSIVSPDNFAADDFEDLPEGPISFIPGSSPEVIGPQQETSERLLVRSYGRFASLRIENASGVCEVTSCAIESTHAMNTGRTAA
jgi:hypothetical protein